MTEYTLFGRCLAKEEQISHALGSKGMRIMRTARLLGADLGEGWKRARPAVRSIGGHLHGRRAVGTERALSGGALQSAAQADPTVREHRHDPKLPFQGRK